jgi:hypothetical protein
MLCYCVLDILGVKYLREDLNILRARELKDFKNKKILFSDEARIYFNTTVIK